MMNLSRYLRRFRDNERGSIALEVVLVVPMLMWAYLSMYSFFHAYRTHALNIKTAYAIGDAISRETNPIDTAYINGMHQMAAYMSWTLPEDFAIRVTSVKYDAAANEYQRDWSQVHGWVPALDNAAVEALRTRLPKMPDGERVVVVETFERYDPPFDMGLSDHEVYNFVFTRPRYAPRVCFDECPEGV